MVEVCREEHREPADEVPNIPRMEKRTGQRFSDGRLITSPFNETSRPSFQPLQQTIPVGTETLAKVCLTGAVGSAEVTRAALDDIVRTCSCLIDNPVSKEPFHAAKYGSHESSFPKSRQRAHNLIHRWKPSLAKVSKVKTWEDDNDWQGSECVRLLSRLVVLCERNR